MIDAHTRFHRPWTGLDVAAVNGVILAHIDPLGEMSEMFVCLFTV